ncbi:MAG: sigma-54-dependent Fis family transcriptional regulator, partial [Ignavibacteriales bacterium]|nr:sigma-54-dependent Fis family transcriptional regulator [Ignavibacteriales bacterium]
MDNKHTRILIIDDDKAFRVATTALLEDNGYTVETANDGKEGVQKFSDHCFDLILSDLVMEGMNGIEVLQSIKQKVPEQKVMMVTGFGSITTAVEAMRKGAYDYLTKPCNNDELLVKVERAVEEVQRERELKRLREMLDPSATFSNIISQNDKMKSVFHMVRQVAETDVTVLVFGETGTGKELFARSV